jgi:Mg2+ and Co2+ transporter CorA
VTWINVDGLTAYLIEPAPHYNRILILEDILTAERPKIEDYGDYLFVVLKVFVRNGNP